MDWNIVYFVKSTAGPSLNKDFLEAKNLTRMHPKRPEMKEIVSSDGIQLLASGLLCYEGIYVLENFEEEFFNLLQYKVVGPIMGPRYFKSNLKSVPQPHCRIFNTAMINLHIYATSDITEKEALRLRMLIEWMGGTFAQHYVRSVTHVISKPFKCLDDNPLHKMMHIDWVQRVWDRSRIDDVSATDAEFSIYRLNLFNGLNITSIGLNTVQINKIKHLLNENGGTYLSKYTWDNIDILICSKNKINSSKYNKAVQENKEIFLSEMVFEYYEKLYSQPQVSTPEQNNHQISLFPSTVDISPVQNRNNKKSVYRRLVDTLDESYFLNFSYSDSSTIDVVQMAGNNQTINETPNTSHSDEYYKSFLDALLPDSAHDSTIEWANNFINDIRNFQTPNSIPDSLGTPQLRLALKKMKPKTPIDVLHQRVLRSCYKHVLGDTAMLDRIKQNNVRPPFSDFKVILHMPEHNLPVIKNLIEAGNGIVIDARTPYTTCCDATHCFVDDEEMPLSIDDSHFLQVHKVRIISLADIYYYIKLSG